jgi:hypothetical protein
MAELSRALADQIADITRLLDDDEDSGPTLRRLTGMAVELSPGGAAESRWPSFCRAAVRAGFRTCLMLPLHVDRRPAGALSVYGRAPRHVA